ncbi:hypothetical protein HK096_007395, partial [Nowakowskiella sp. JEL0078]
EKNKLDNALLLQKKRTSRKKTLQKENETSVNLNESDDIDNTQSNSVLSSNESILKESQEIINECNTSVNFKLESSTESVQQKFDNSSSEKEIALNLNDCTVPIVPVPQPSQTTLSPPQPPQPPPMPPGLKVIPAPPSLQEIQVILSKPPSPPPIPSSLNKIPIPPSLPPGFQVGPPPPPPPPMPPGFSSITLPPVSQPTLTIPPPPPPPSFPIESNINILTLAPQTPSSHNALLDELNDPNLRKRLKSRGASNAALKPQKQSEESAESKEKELRNDLLVEMLGYMQSEGGNLEELVDKCKLSSEVSRGFIYTVARRGWVRCVRVIGSDRPKQLCLVWPGKEWTTAITLDDVLETYILDFDEDAVVARVHMYRFDNVSKQHTVDEIVIIKTENFPQHYVPFTEVKPVQDNTLDARKQLELWTEKKLEHEQSDSAQLELVFSKLMKNEEVVFGTFSQLKTTVKTMRDMAESVKMECDLVSVKLLKEIVENIPNHIKNMAQKFNRDTGIIIKDDNVKITPEFLKQILPSSLSSSSTSLNDSNTSLSVNIENNNRLGVSSSIKKSPSSSYYSEMDSVTFAGLKFNDIFISPDSNSAMKLKKIERRSTTIL